MAHRDEIPASVVLPFADLEALAKLRDKRKLSAVAASVGLTTPKTLMEATASEIAANPPPLPVAIKQVLPEGSLNKRTRIVTNRAELDALLAVVPPEEPLLVQEKAEGPLIGLALVLDTHGQLVARFQQFARRLWPVDAGGSTLAVSMAPDEDLVKRCTRMLAACGFSGLAQLQFLRTDRGPALIDVNPRFYGSMALASASGLNLASAWHKVIIGESLSSVPDYRAGVHYRWLEGDVTAAFNGSPGRLLARTRSQRRGRPGLEMIRFQVSSSQPTQRVHASVSVCARSCRNSASRAARRSRNSKPRTGKTNKDCRRPPIGSVLAWAILR